MSGSPTGVLPVDKPLGFTSHDVVAKVRRALATRKVGHAGTLDPAATGLLLCMVGEATKLSQYLMNASKDYEAVVRFGVETDTLDAEGQVVASDPDFRLPNKDKLNEMLNGLKGVMLQVPPRYSAIRVEGQRAYQRARAGEVRELEPRQVWLKEAVCTEVSAESATLHLTCGKGFYVRAFARDVARSLSTVGYLTALRRTRVGGFRVEHATTCTGLDQPGGQALIGLREAGEGCMPSVTLSMDKAMALRQGKQPEADASCPEETFLALDHEEHVVAVAVRRDGRLLSIRGFQQQPAGAARAGSIPAGVAAE